jgi:hypothetical protein
MKIEIAIKKLTKAGFKIVSNSSVYSAKKDGCKYLVEFYRNGGTDEATCIGYRRENDHSDSMIDYCATFFCNNISQAIKRATA